MIQVDEYIFRGPRPDNFCAEWLVMNGFQKSIDLEEGWFRLFHGLAYEDYETHFPMSDVFPPRTHTLFGICTLLEFYKNSKLKTYVHCLHGEDRTGIVCAAYRILNQNWHTDDAIAECKKLGFHMFPYFYWLPVLKRLK